MTDVIKQIDSATIYVGEQIFYNMLIEDLGVKKYVRTFSEYYSENTMVLALNERALVLKLF